jgi:hypothetical protein
MDRILRALKWLARPLLNEDGYWVPIVLAVAATAASTYSAYQSGKMQQRAADTSATLAERDAANQRAAAKIKAENYSEETSRHMATMRARYAASGVTMEGTPLLVMMDTARQVEKDLQRIRWGGEAQANAFEGEAGLQRMMGKQAYQTGIMGAGTSLLTGASRIAWMSYTAGK